MNGNPDFLLDLAGAVSDGARVDWATLTQRADADATRELLHEMAILARVADVHQRSEGPRSAAASDDPWACPPTGPESDGLTYSAGRTDDDRPTTWGPLTLLERMGEGAFGEVFRARDNRLDREVALKLLRPAGTDQAGPDAAATIEEGRLLARVRHPNVVTVYGAERINGRIGIWTEFIDGHTLSALVAERGPIPLEEVIDIALALCRALAAVHEAGLVHRDIKAQNVMRETGGRIVLMDFGTGSLVDDSANARAAGTPLYLAPEVLGGAPQGVRADIYSVGVLLYYLLTGAFPVEGHTLGDIVAAHAAGRRIELRGRREDVPVAVAAVIDRAISADPATRFDSAAAVEHALGAAASPRRASRMRVGWVVTALVLLTSAAGVAWRMEYAAPARFVFKPRDFVLIGAFDNRTGTRSLDGVMEAAIDRELANSDFVMSVPQQRVDDALRLMAKPIDISLRPAVAREVCLRDGAIRAYVAGQIDRTDGRYRLTASVFDPHDGHAVTTVTEEAMGESVLPIATHQLADRIRTSLGESVDTIRASQALEKVTTPSLQADKLFSDGLRAFNRRSLPEADGKFSEALALDPQFGSALIWSAWARRLMGRPPPEWRALAQRAMDRASGVGEHEREWIAASYYEFMGRPELAIGEYEVLVRRYPDDANALGNLMILYASNGAPWRNRLDLDQKRVDAQPLSFRSQAAFAFALLHAEGPEAARPHFARARQLMPDVIDQSDPAFVARIAISLLPAFELWTEGRAAEAARVLDSASDRPEFAADGAWTLVLLGAMRLALGQVHLAENAFNRISATSEPGFRRFTLAEAALARGDRARIVARLQGTPAGFSSVSLLIRAGQLDEAARFLPIISRNNPSLQGEAVWSGNEIEEARGNRQRITRALDAGTPWMSLGAGNLSTFLYSETLASAAAKIGNRTAAIKILEETAPLGSRAYGEQDASAFYWMRDQKLLADLYRDDGQIERARLIEQDLLTRLAVADPDFPLLVALKERVRR